MKFGEIEAVWRPLFESTPINRTSVCFCCVFLWMFLFFPKIGFYEFSTFFLRDVGLGKWYLDSYLSDGGSDSVTSCAKECLGQMDFSVG